MKKLFNPPPPKNLTPTPEYFKNKRQLLLTYIGGEWYIKKLRHPEPPEKIRV